MCSVAVPDPNHYWSLQSGLIFLDRFSTEKKVSLNVFFIKFLLKKIVSDLNLHFLALVLVFVFLKWSHYT